MRSVSGEEDKMQESRWLLPFTSTINLRAIDLVLGMAEQCGATLIAASLIEVPDMQREQKHQGPRLEHVQQSKDFLEAMRWKATQYRVTIEPHELWTGNIHERIKKLV